MKRDEGSLVAITIIRRSDRFRQESAYRQGVALAVRVEKCGKSALDGWEQSIAVNSIRSNTGMGAGASAPRLARPLPGWLERTGNGTSR